MSNINVSAASAEPEHLVAMRGLLHIFTHSDLEVVCVEFASEVDYSRSLPKYFDCYGSKLCRVLNSSLQFYLWAHFARIIWDYC